MADEQKIQGIDTIIQGDCLDVLRTLDDNSVDAIVTDPPAGISFMGKDWDNPDTFPLRDRGERLTGSGHSTLARGFAKGMTLDSSKRGRDTFISFITAVMAECLRVLKPGGHALIWALPRTSHWTATAIEDAGFEIRDVVTHLFGSGFPKSMNVSKAIDATLLHGSSHTRALKQTNEQDREKIGERVEPDRNNGFKREYTELKTVPLTLPATSEAHQWDGWGTALKPANEHWILARKPLSEKSIAANVLKWETGGLNIDACRVGDGHDSWGTRPPRTPNAIYGNGNGTDLLASESHPSGKRFPANLLLSHSWLCTDERCDEHCPVRLLDEQSGIRKSESMRLNSQTNRTAISTRAHNARQPNQTDSICSYGDIGGASRYFPTFHYFPKASRSERNRGCEGLQSVASSRYGKMQGTLEHTPKYNPPEQNHHPTVKSLALMSWLIRLITPPGGTVLDCFAGSGSTLVACVQEGFHFIGIEQSTEYVAIAEARLAHAYRDR